MIFNVVAGWVVRIALIALGVIIVIGIITDRQNITTTRKCDDGKIRTMVIPWNRYMREYVLKPRVILVSIGWLVLTALAFVEPVLGMM